MEPFEREFLIDAAEACLANPRETTRDLLRRMDRMICVELAGLNIFDPPNRKFALAVLKLRMPDEASACVNNAMILLLNHAEKISKRKTEAA